MDYDLAIVGGGIAGAGVAQVAAAAGFKVLLLEKSGFGSQTLVQFQQADPRRVALPGVRPV